MEEKLKFDNTVNKLIKILEALKHINQLFKKKIITNVMLREEEENIFDYAQNEREFNILLNELLAITDQDLKQIVFVNGETVNKLTKLLIDLHFYISNYVWHFDQLDELTMYMLKEYKEDHP